MKFINVLTTGAIILSAATMVFAQDDSSESAIQQPTKQMQDAVDKIETKPQIEGAIQDPSNQNKKIIKKIMTRKEKAPAKKGHGKHAPAKTEEKSETK